MLHASYSHLAFFPPPTDGFPRFAERFPLSPELWEGWIEDRRASGGDEMLEDVLGLYSRAFEDYQCGNLWLSYLKTLEESLDVSRRT